MMNLLFLVLMIVGGIALSLLPKDVYPDIELDAAIIRTTWPGAPAEDIERLITKKIEEEVDDVEGIDRIISNSQQDLSLIEIKFNEDLSQAQADAAYQDLRNALDRVTDLPADAERPELVKLTVDEVFPLVQVAIADHAHHGEQVLHDVARQLRRVLRDVEGVAKVDDILIRDREVTVELDPTRLRRFQLTSTDVVDVLAAYNRNVPAGTLDGSATEITVRAVGDVKTPQELKNVVIRKDPAAGHVYLKDVADINPGFERRTYATHYNGVPALILNLAKHDDADSMATVRRVEHAIDDFARKRRLPPTIEIATVNDSTDIIRSRLGVLISNLLTGSLLVAIVLWLFLGRRNAVLAVVGIPFSFLCAFIFMRLFGVTINAVSLFAMLLCSGIVVDDAIVVLENIYRHVQAGDDLRESILTGTGEVFWPVISSTTTTLAAFLPMLIMVGVTGRFFAIIPKTVAVILLASLVECMLMLPVHYLHWGSRPRAARKIPLTAPPHLVASPHPIAQLTPAARRPSSVRISLLAAYDGLLHGCLRFRYLVLLIVLAIVFMAANLAPLLKVDLFPSDFQVFLVNLKLRPDTSLDGTIAATKPIEDVLNQMRPGHVKAFLSELGFTVTDDNVLIWRPSVAQLYCSLADRPAIREDPEIVLSLVRRRLAAYLAAHPGSPIESFKVWAPQDGPPFGKPVAVRIECNDYQLAKQIAREIKNTLAHLEGVHGIADNLDLGPHEVRLRIKEAQASVHGLTFLHLARVLQIANDGAVVSTFKDTASDEDLDVRVKWAPRRRADLVSLMDADVRTPAGHIVQLRDVADLDIDQTYAVMYHRDTRRTVLVTAEVDTAQTTGQAVNQFLAARFADASRRYPGARLVFGGEFEETRKSFASLERAFFIAILLIYFILAAQFRSYVQPVVVMCTVPCACVGVVVGLYLAGYPFTIMTGIALTGLAGVVVNDSLILIDFVNNARGRGAAVVDALREACHRRARPILLTTVTTVFGLLPMALGLFGRSKIWSPTAAVLVWGLSFASLLTLFVIPALYLILEDVKCLLHRTDTFEQLAPSSTAPADAS